jgi:hypothetical protein
MKYRLAKISDYKTIADIHYSIRESYSVGIFSKLGKSFLRKYYKVLLNDPNSIVVCAENQGVIHGFCSATLDVEAQMINLRRHKWSLAFASFWSVLRNPYLFKHLYDRYMHNIDETEIKIISAKGARSEYWAWSSSSQDSLSSVEMYYAKLNILKALGVKDLYGEVDLINKRILRFQLGNGAEIVEKLILPDGRERVLLRTPLSNWKTIN